MRIVGVIEARMGSSRFPGKVLEKLAGQTILWHVVHRMRCSKVLTHIVLATTTESRDDRLVAEAETLGIDVVRGSENNLLARHLRAASRFIPDIIVRVTGDCPLVDALLIDALVKRLIKTGADYCTAEKGVPCIHEGIDPFTFGALRKLANQAANDPIAQEHVSSYFKHHADFVKIAYLPIGPEYQLKGARVSVDTPADLSFLQQIYDRLGVAAGEADMKEVVRLLKASPELLRINAHVHQKSAHEGTRRVLIRCDGYGKIGLGHVVRCLALADEFRETHGFGVTFAVCRGEVARALIQEHRFPIQKVDVTEEATGMEKIIAEIRPDVLLLDIRTSLSARDVLSWKNKGLFVVVVDDPSERRLHADRAIYPMVPQVQKLNWQGFSGQLMCGWEWILLRKEFAIHRPKERADDRLQVLVSMGGSDPKGLTLMAIEALESLEEDFDTTVIVGPAYMHRSSLDQTLLNTRRKYHVLANAKEIWHLMASADLAIASFGTTAYELAAEGVPSLLLCITDDHAESASALHDAGMAISLGNAYKIDPSDLAAAARRIISDDRLRASMRKKALAVIDGKGTARCAAEIAHALLHLERHP